MKKNYGLVFIDAGYIVGEHEDNKIIVKLSSITDLEEKLEDAGIEEDYTYPSGYYNNYEGVSIISSLKEIGFIFNIEKQSEVDAFKYLPDYNNLSNFEKNNLEEVLKNLKALGIPLNDNFKNYKKRVTTLKYYSAFFINKDYIKGHSENPLYFLLGCSGFKRKGEYYFDIEGIYDEEELLLYDKLEEENIDEVQSGIYEYAPWNPSKDKEKTFLKIKEFESMGFEFKEEIQKNINLFFSFDDLSFNDLTSSQKDLLEDLIIDLQDYSSSVQEQYKSYQKGEKILSDIMFEKID